MLAQSRSRQDVLVTSLYMLNESGDPARPTFPSCSSRAPRPPGCNPHSSSWQLKVGRGQLGSRFALHPLPVEGRHTEPDRIQPDLEADDELVPVIRESSRGGNEPPPEVNDQPEQNVAYDEAVKGAPLSAEERERAKKESPLSD